MAKIRQIIFITGCLSLFALHGWGQDVAMNLPSPTAANLGLYGEIPVSYYTGTPNISIPLYEIKGKHVRVPIALTYHPSGIRPEIHPGPTGLGWSLQAGGVITRTVKGPVPDENESLRPAIASWEGVSLVPILLADVTGYLSPTNSWIADIDWKAYTKKTLSDCEVCKTKVLLPSDWEPDEFSFNFLGISGKFYFDRGGKIQVQSDRTLSVVYNGFITAADLQLEYTNSPELYSHRMIQQFIITDEFGTRYYFGGAEAIELSDPATYGFDSDSDGNAYSKIPDGDHLHATSWFLTKIESADGLDEIAFDYERGPFTSQLYLTYYGKTIKTFYGSTSYMIEGNFISPVYLSEIKQTNGDTVAFAYTKSNELSYGVPNYTALFEHNRYHPTKEYPLLQMISGIQRLQNLYPENILEHIQWLKMDMMTVGNSRGDDIKGVHFIYNDVPDERLFLEKLDIYGNYHSVLYKEPVTYNFKYKDREKLPPYLQTLTDHWGFNNGIIFKTTTEMELQRSVNPLYTTSGVLDTMYYPTGGYTAFEYAVHDYSKIVDTLNRSRMNTGTGIAGGLRIRKISSSDLMGVPIVREFFYQKTLSSSISSGVLNALPYYVRIIKNATTCDGHSLSSYRQRYGGKPVIPLTKGNDGLYIGYTTVWEKISSGNDNGYTKYTYTNHDNGHYDVLLENGLWKRESFIDNPHNSRFFERGRLLEKQHYNATNQLLWEQRTEWNRYGPKGEENPRAVWFAATADGGLFCSSVAYLNYCYKFLPSRKEEITYSPGQSPPFVRTNDYIYNSDYLPLSETTTDSEGQHITTHYRYPKDILNDYTENRSAYQWLVDHHVMNRPIEQIQYRGGMVVAANYTEYTLFDGKAYPKTDWALKTVQPVADYDTLYKDRRLAIQVNYERYDTNGNVLQQRGVDGLTVSTLWDYSGRYKLAEAVGATYEELQSTATDMNLLVMTPNERYLKDMRALREELPQAMITNYTYEPSVGLTSQTDPNGITTYFEYDDLGRLKRVRDYERNVLKEYEYRYFNE